MSKFSYKADPDCGLLEIFIDGVLFAEWSYEDNPEDGFKEFKRIYNRGFTDGRLSGQESMRRRYRQLTEFLEPH